MLAFLLIIIPLLVLLFLVLGWSLALGALLALIFPLTFFEGSLLAMLGTGISLSVLMRTNPLDLPDDDATYFRHEIPLERFIKPTGEVTLGDMFRHEVANAIYVKFKDANLESETLTSTQLQEIAIRLADLGTTVLKRKSPKATSLTVTAAQLKNQMTRQKLQPYDEDILAAASAGIALALTAEELREIIRDKEWDEVMPTLRMPED
jgi:hypothetical protein